MRASLVILPLIASLAACSASDSFENQGEKAGAAADNAIARIGNEVDAERGDLENNMADVREKARGVERDVKEGLNKAENAVDAAAAELQK